MSNSGDMREDLVTLLPPLRAFARTLCGDPTLADDLVQESLLKAWASRDRFEPGTNLRAWVFTILRNIFYSGRRNGRREILDADGMYADTLSVSPEHDSTLALHDMNAALQKLPDEQREALLLVCASGVSCEEAAEICGCPVGTIKSRMARGRDRLVELLGSGTSRTEEYSRQQVLRR
jgi:RNA polymerase sigma-70 factor, ECF subfamily